MLYLLLLPLNYKVEVESDLWGVMKLKLDCFPYYIHPLILQYTTTTLTATIVYCVWVSECGKYMYVCSVGVHCLLTFYEN